MMFGGLVFFFVGCRMVAVSNFGADLCSVLIGFGNLENVAGYFKLRFPLMVSVRGSALEFYG